MEFENLGQHCSYCRQKDFLPFTCKFCKKPFCLQHRTIASHECEEASKVTARYEYDNDKDKKTKPKIKRLRCHICNRKNTSSQLVYPCNDCNQNVCMNHRYTFEHECISTIKKPIVRKNKKKKVKKVKEQAKEIEMMELTKEKRIKETKIKEKPEKHKGKKKERCDFWKRIKEICYCCH